MSHSIIHTAKFHSIPVISFFYLFNPCFFRLLHFILKLYYYYILALESLERREKVGKKIFKERESFWSIILILVFIYLVLRE